MKFSAAIMFFLCIAGTASFLHAMEKKPDQNRKEQNIKPRSTAISDSEKTSASMPCTLSTSTSRVFDVVWRPDPLSMSAENYHWMLSGWSNMPPWATPSMQNPLRLSVPFEETAYGYESGLMMLLRAVGPKKSRCTSGSSGSSGSSSVLRTVPAPPLTPAAVLLFLVLAAVKK